MYQLNQIPSEAQIKKYIRRILFGKNVFCPRCSVKHAAQFLEQYIKPHSQLNTDGARIYPGIEGWWPVDHKRDIHRKWEFGLTSEIEGVFGNLCTFIRRMCHHTRPEQLPEYVGEFCYRFSSPQTFKNPLNYLNKSLKLVPIR